MRHYLSRRQTALELKRQEIRTLKDIIDSAFENLLAAVYEYRKA
jgi:argininosuccinate lyase